MWIFSKLIIVSALFSLFLVYTQSNAYAPLAQWALEQDPVLSHVCDLVDTHIVCSEPYQTQVALLEEPIEKIVSLMDRLSVQKKSAFLSLFRSFVDLLEKRMYEVQDDAQLFKIVYIRFVLQDILYREEYREHALLLTERQMEGLVRRWWTGKELHKAVKQFFVQQLVRFNFPRFATRPYVGGTDHITTTWWDWTQYAVNTSVPVADALDRDIIQGLEAWQAGDEFIIGPDVWTEYFDINLFRTIDDLNSLWYQVVSHRTRINRDEEYRRKNIATAFNHIGAVRIINPWETFAYLDQIQFDAWSQWLYLSGKVIFLDEEVDQYWWGLCGWSTALYQGTVLNTWLSFSTRNHSKRYTSLYTAEINGERISTPGIDSTIYYPYLDLAITNIADYPIILVSNYNGLYDAKEEVFTLWYPTERGSAVFVSKEKKIFELQKKWWWTRESMWACYTWNINDELVKRCYKEIF